MTQKAGRKDPTDDKLQGAQLIFQVGLKKEWADQCSYWIELYYRDVPLPKKQRRPGKEDTRLFYVYRQWSFFKRGEGVIDGHITYDPMTSLPAVENALVAAVEQRLGKGDQVHYMKEHDEWPGFVAMMEGELAVMQNQGAQQMQTKIKNRPATLAEKFKETQQEREKKAEW